MNPEDLKEKRFDFYPDGTENYNPEGRYVYFDDAIVVVKNARDEVTGKAIDHVYFNKNTPLEGLEKHLNNSSKFTRLIAERESVIDAETRIRKQFQKRETEYIKQVETRTLEWVEKYLDKYGSITKAHYEVEKKKYLEVFQ